MGGAGVEIRSAVDRAGDGHAGLLDEEVLSRKNRGQREVQAESGPGDERAAVRRQRGAVLAS